MTGSSWTTIATIGIALMGIGKAQGFEEGWIAGAIISGAYFGDKISPLSDTTILAASVTDTPLFRHIRYMLITTVPSLIITLVIFTVAGLSHNAGSTEHIAEFSAALAGKFHITPWLLIVPVVTGVLIAWRVPSVITLFLSAALAGAFAVFFQPDLLQEISGLQNSEGTQSIFKGLMMTLYGGTSLQTSNEALTELVATRYGRHDEYGMAYYLCDVFRRGYDCRRHVRKYHFRICPLHEKYSQHGGLYGLLWYFPEPRHSRSVY